MNELSSEMIWGILEQVTDPEIPVISVVDMGIIRSVALDGDFAKVVMTPTFAGCPALAVMRSEIEKCLLAAGVRQVEVSIVLAPPWSSNWITARGRKSLKEFGLAPPPLYHDNIEAAWEIPAICPYCSSEDTEMKNDFGPTLCRTLYVCRNCRQPFEQFKPI